jgi:hypothetical protein
MGSSRKGGANGMVLFAGPYGAAIADSSGQTVMHKARPDPFT